MVIALYLPFCCLFVAITSQKAQIILLEQVSFTFFLEQAGFYLGYHFTVMKLYLTLQMK